ncbi:hypothetical protein V8F06_002600 [Rhypophila decipiens]
MTNTSSTHLPLGDVPPFIANRQQCALSLGGAFVELLLCRSPLQELAASTFFRPLPRPLASAKVQLSLLRLLRMDFHLAREFETLGTDFPLRRRNLLNLLSSLNLYELRDVGSYIESLDFRTDILARLPPELHLCIAEHVDKTDIKSFLDVSKRWRTIWSQDSMIRILMPDLWEYHCQKEKIASSGQNLQVLFHDACRRRRIRSRSGGRYRSVLNEAHSPSYDKKRRNPLKSFNIAYDDSVQGGEDSKYPWWTPTKSHAPRFRNFLYYDGRVVWQPSVEQYCHGFIIVDDLRTQLRKAYTIPGAVMLGGEPELLAVGNKLVVAGQERTLHAWDFETNDHRSVTLPSSNLGCKTYDKEVYAYSHLLSRNGRVPKLEIYVWKFQQHVRELDTRALLDAIGRPSDNSVSWNCTGIIAHPLLDETIFVVCRLGNDTVSLHKYTLGVYCSSQSFTAPKGKWGDIQGLLSERLAPVNPYGSFAVAVFARNKRYDDDCSRTHIFRVVCFDALRELFSVEEYPLHTTAITKTGDSTWWDSQVVLSVRDVKRFAGSSVGPPETVCLIMADKAVPTNIVSKTVDSSADTDSSDDMGSLGDMDSLYDMDSSYDMDPLDDMDFVAHISLSQFYDGRSFLPKHNSEASRQWETRRQWDWIEQNGGPQQWPRHPQYLWADDNFIVVQGSHVESCGYLALSTDTKFRRAGSTGSKKGGQKSINMA